MNSLSGDHRPSSRAWASQPDQVRRLSITTSRLLLRRWQISDFAPYARMNRDPRVVEFYPGFLPELESQRRISNAIEHFEQHGFGPWAAELRSSEQFIGHIGLNICRHPKIRQPIVAIGWRLASDYWNLGLATEGAKAVAWVAFNVLGIKELCAWTVATNSRSLRVMNKIGMIHDADGDFEDQQFPVGHSLRYNVLYRITAPLFRPEGEPPILVF